jgi:hypothetical protein
MLQRRFESNSLESYLGGSSALADAGNGCGVPDEEAEWLIWAIRARLIHSCAT